MENKIQNKFFSQYNKLINKLFAYVNNSNNKDDIEQDKLLCYYLDSNIERLYSKGHDRKAWNLYQNLVRQELKKYDQFNINLKNAENYDKSKDITHDSNPIIDDEGSYYEFVDTLNSGVDIEQDLIDKESIEQTKQVIDFIVDEKDLPFMLDYQVMTRSELSAKYGLSEKTLYSKYSRLKKKYSQGK